MQTKGLLTVFPSAKPVWRYWFWKSLYVHYCNRPLHSYTKTKMALSDVWVPLQNVTPQNITPQNVTPQNVTPQKVTSNKTSPHKTSPGTKRHLSQNVTKKRHQTYVIAVSTMRNKTCPDIIAVGTMRNPPVHS